VRVEEIAPPFRMSVCEMEGRTYDELARASWLTRACWWCGLDAQVAKLLVVKRVCANHIDDAAAESSEHMATCKNPWHFVVL
jgi:hypothetical protein